MRTFYCICREKSELFPIRFNTGSVFSRRRSAAQLENSFYFAYFLQVACFSESGCVHVCGSMWNEAASGLVFLRRASLLNIITAECLTVSWCFLMKDGEKLKEHEDSPRCWSFSRFVCFTRLKYLRNVCVARWIKLNKCPDLFPDVTNLVSDMNISPKISKIRGRFKRSQRKGLKGQNIMASVRNQMI